MARLDLPLTTPPICVEFSFKYGDNDEDYRGTVARDAHDALQVRLVDRLPLGSAHVRDCAQRRRVPPR
jgi:hypothetical protein